jgi:hypothetical protein
MIKMSPVRECDATDCAYNDNKICHALAITIGGPSGIPYCDTYTSSSEKGGDGDVTGGVGACKVSACEYNERLGCTADDIEVGFKNNKVACLTFEPR